MSPFAELFIHVGLLISVVRESVTISPSGQLHSRDRSVHDKDAESKKRTRMRKLKCIRSSYTTHILYNGNTKVEHVQNSFTRQ
jgi:hypothetical protein